jgi:hypothetical protein
MSEHKVGDLLLGFDFRRKPQLGYICEIVDGQYVIDWIEVGRATSCEVDIKKFKNNLRSLIDTP